MCVQLVCPPSKDECSSICCCDTPHYAYTIPAMQLLIFITLALGALHSTAQQAPLLSGFGLDRVKIANTTYQAKAAISNLHYLLDLLPLDGLLWNFRKNAWPG